MWSSWHKTEVKKLRFYWSPIFLSIWLIFLFLKKLVFLKQQQQKSFYGVLTFSYKKLYY